MSTEGLDPLVAALIRESEASVRARPGDANAVGRLGMVLDAHGLLEAAALAYARAQELAPEDPRWPALEAGAQPADPERAFHCLERAHELAPEECAVGLRLARECARRGQLERSRALFRALHEKSPTDPHVLTGLAILALDDGDAQQAADWSAAALQEAPRHREALAVRARALRRLGAVEEAERCAAAATRETGSTPYRDPLRAEVQAMTTNVAATRSVLARRLARGQLDKVAATLDRLIGLGPEVAQAFATERGLLALQRGQRGVAARHLMAALDADPGDRTALDAAYVTLPALGKGADMLRYVRAAKVGEGVDRTLLGYEARLLSSLGRDGEAIDLLATLEGRPAFGAPERAMLAWLLATTGDASRRDGQRALALVRTLPAAGPRELPRRLDLEAVAAAAAGDFAHAAERARAAVAAAEQVGDHAFLAQAQARAATFARGRPWIESR